MPGEKRESTSHREGEASSGVHPRERLIVFILCVVAAFRVFLFSAAYPFFSVADEPQHFDNIVKYSHRHVPRNIEPYSPDSSTLIVLFGTTEYLVPPEAFPDGEYPSPIWTLPKAEVEPRLRPGVRLYETLAGTEATQPPVYYAVAAVWYKVGQSVLRLRGGWLLYWIRLMNAPICALLVWLGYVFGRRFYPRNAFMRLGMPAMLTFFPQNVYYALNNDVPSALFCGLAMYCMLVMYLDEPKDRRFYALTGLLVAAAFLVKYTNFVIPLACAAILILRLRKARRSGTTRVIAPSLALTSLAALIPSAAWLIRSYAGSGDLTGSAAKIETLGWTAKPFAGIWDHPIFTNGGVLTFWHELMGNFWRGELTWHGQSVTSPGPDLFYSISSVVLILIAVIGIRRHAGTNGDARLANWIGAGMFLASVLFMLAMSVAFDFGDCVNPSAEHPYFVAGRLISGTLIPFVMLYLTGLDMVLRKIRLPYAGPICLALIILVMLGTQLSQCPAVFSSAYNFLHML